MADFDPAEEEAPAETGLEVEPGRVAVTDGSTVQTLPIEQYDAAREQGFRPATKGEWRAEKEGALGTIKAGVYGAARGVSFGTFDPLAVGASRALYGDEGAEFARQELEGQREAHPTLTTGTEIAGSLAPLAFGAPPVEAAGALGEGLLARAGGRVLAAAPRLFGEGAAFGLQHQLTEDTLGNHEMVAGKYLAAGLEGGLVNLLLGGALHAAGGAVVDRLATRGASTGESLASRAVGGLKGIAEEQAAKGAMPAAGIGASAMSRLGATAEEQSLRVRQVGRTLLDEGITTPLAGKAVQAERLTKRVAEVGGELGAIRKTLDGTGFTPDAPNIFRRITNEVVAPLLERPFSDTEYRTLAPYIEELGERLGKDGRKGTTFAEAFELRDALDDKLAKFWKMPVEARPAGLEEVAKVRRILEQEIEAAADRAAENLGDDIGTKYKVAKALFSDLKTAEGWATKAAGREAQHRAISLTDTIAAGSGLATGGALGAIAAPLANKALRTYGNQTAAFVLDRITKLEALQRAVVAFDTKLAASTKAFFGDGPPPAKALRHAAITPAERVALRRAAANPSALVEHVGDMVAKTGVRDAAPNIAGAMTQNVMRAIAFVAQKLPPEPRPIGVSFGPPKPRPVGQRQQAEIDRAINALDTDKMLDDFAGRRLSREQVEALKFVNPDLFAAMQKSVRDYGMANDPKMTTQHEMALSIVFDTPVSSYTRGATIRGFQQAFAQGAPSEDPTRAGGQTGEPIGTGHSSAAESMASPTDRAEANGAL